MMENSVACRYKIVIGVIIGCLLYGNMSYAATNSKAHKEKSHQKQKRLKTNPVTDEESAWIANVETDVYRAGTYENVLLGYSAKNGWDFSVSLLNAQVFGPNQLFQGESFVSIAKTFTLNNDLSVTVGSQNGVYMVNQKPQQWLNYTYLDTRYDVAPWLLMHGGTYIANAALTGTSRQVGFITGTEITFIPNKLALQMDYISGHQSLSGATVNMLVNILPQWQIYMGVSVPEKNSGNEFAGIIGFNLSTKNL
jgi:hypothetical protein